MTASSRHSVSLQSRLITRRAGADGLVNGTRGVIVGFVRRPSETEVREAVRSKDTQNAKYARRREMIGTEEWKAEAQIEYYDLQRHDWLPEVYFGNRRRLNHNESEERTRRCGPLLVDVMQPSISLGFYSQVSSRPFRSSKTSVPSSV